jgi:hypothetical protein
VFPNWSVWPMPSEKPTIINLLSIFCFNRITTRR